MSQDKEYELKVALEGLAERLGIKGYLHLYLDGDRIKFTGNMSISALTPFLIDWLSRKK